MSSDASPKATMRATRVNAPGRYRPDIDRWAIIVGISTYQHTSLNLKWARRDAEALHRLLLTPTGGSFTEDHVQLLVDEAATTGAVTRALRSFLKKPARDDMVLIYVACHGAPDPDRPENLYLLTHDTDPDDIAGTALPMREIDLSLRENLLAERVVILADTCHSAGIGGGIGRRSVTADAGVMNAYLDAMSKARGGLALLTSAEASETSQEDVRWGGGHGVFTYYLLEGMSGAADGFSQPRDGKVAIGELFDYVRHHVQQATGNSQHPAIGSNPFDRDLPLAITGGIGAQEHLDLGRCLHELARIANEPDRYRAAARQFEEALRLSSLAGAPLPEASWRLAQAWLAAGETDRAVEAMEHLRKRVGEELPPPARFTLALAQAVQGDTTAAIASLQNYLERHPDDTCASWGRYCLAVLRRPIVPRALLIGIGEHAEERLGNLIHPANDVALFKDMLASNLGFSDRSIQVLRDEDASWTKIADALKNLADAVQPLDPVVVYLSGRGFTDEWLFSYEGPKTRILELHGRLAAIPSKTKFLIVDGDSSQHAIELANQTVDYALFMAAKPGEQVNRHMFAAKEHGLFTYCLTQAIKSLTTKPATLKEVFQVCRAMMRSLVSDQTPMLAGKFEQGVLGALASNQDFAYLSAPEQWVYQAETLQDLDQAYGRFQTLQAVPYAQAHLSFGRAFLDRGATEQAMAALATAASQDDVTPQVLLALGKAEVNARQDSAAQTTFQRLSSHPSSSQHRQIQELCNRVVDLATVQRHALVVGVDCYTSNKILPLIGAANDARAMRMALIQQLGFSADNITLLLNEEATRERVAMAFHALAKKATKEPSLFYFSGYAGRATLLCTDSFSDDTNALSLSELADVAAPAQQLAVIGDVGPNPILDWPQLGRTSVWGHGAVEIQMPTALMGESEPQIHSSWTYSLLKVLAERERTQLTYGDWITSAQKIARAHSLATTVARGILDETIFDLVQKRQATIEAATRIELAALYHAIELLDHQISERRQQGALHPDGWVSLGVAYGVLGDYPRALEAAAAATTPAKAEMAQSVAHDVSPEEIAPQISYHLGRLLLASQQDYSRAVSELRSATLKDANNGRAFYYLGRAIREMVQRETLAEVEDAFGAYLNLGAPVGHRSEVVEFLRQRQADSPALSSA